MPVLLGHVVSAAGVVFGGILYPHPFSSTLLNAVHDDSPLVPSLRLTARCPVCLGND